MQANPGPQAKPRTVKTPGAGRKYPDYSFDNDAVCLMARFAAGPEVSASSESSEGTLYRRHVSEPCPQAEPLNEEEK
jgi:hypothetical protein